MSDDTVSQAEETVSRADFANLQEQLKVVKAERDRQIFEKSEIVTKANAYAKERDDLRTSVAEITTERDKFVAERIQLVAKLRETGRLATEAAQRLDEATAEIARLRNIIDTAPSNDPVDVIQKLVADKTKAAIAWVRGKLPADGPLLSNYDKTIDAVTHIAWAAASILTELYKIVAPKAVEFFHWGRREVEARLARKEG